MEKKKKTLKTIKPAHGSEGITRENTPTGISGIIGTACFVLLLAASSVMLWAFPTDLDSIAKENREVTSMPATDLKTITSGAFTKGFESYLNDHVGFRGVLQNASDVITSRTGFDCGSGEFLSYQKDIGTQTKDDTLLMYHDYKLLEIFYENKEITQQYIDALGEIADAAGSGINCYSMVIPTQLEFDDPYYSDVQSSQKAAIDEIYEGVSDKFTCVDAYTELDNHKDEYIYFRSDHHWTQLGAYYAYRQYCEAAELNAADKSNFSVVDYEVKNKTDMLGSLYQYTNYAAMKKQPDKIEWYNTDPDNNVSIICKGRDGKNLAEYKGTLFDHGIKEPNYSFYLGGDHHYMKIENENAETDRTLLIVRDSYANAFVPWLVNNYKTIIAYDPRSALTELPELIAGESIDDILVMNYIFSSGFTDYCVTLSATADKIKESNNAVMVENGEIIAFHDDMLVEVFYDNVEHRKEYTDGLIESADALPDDTKKYIMIAPTAAAYDKVAIGDNRSVQKKVTDSIYNDLKDIYLGVNIFNTLDEHKNEYLYFRSDHHWTQLGAYYAYLEYCSTAGLEPVSISDYKLNKLEGMLGSHYAQRPEASVEKNPDTLEWYETDPDDKIKLTPVTAENGKAVEYTAKMYWDDMSELKYSFFLGGDHHFIKLENTSLNNGKTLLIAHDSYANALLPWLINNYKTIIAYDPLSTLEILPELLENQHIDDFLVMNYISSTTADTYSVDTKIMAELFREAWPQ